MLRVSKYNFNNFQASTKRVGSTRPEQNKRLVIFHYNDLHGNTDKVALCRKEKHLDHETDTSLMSGDQNIEDRYLSKESAFEIHKILHKLPEPYKEVFSLRAFGELSYQQIAELFGKTETWARVTYHRARLKIKEELK